MDGGFDGSFVGREGKSVFRVSIPVIIFSFRVVLCNRPATRGPADLPGVLLCWKLSAGLCSWRLVI